VGARARARLRAAALHLPQPRGGQPVQRLPGRDERLRASVAAALELPRRGVCDGIAAHPRCIYAGEADNIPVHFSAFQKERLGWLDADQIATHYGGSASYRLSAPTYNPNRLPTAEKLKLVEVPIPNSTAYYALEYRRGDDGDASNASAYRRGWDAREKGIASGRVTVYKVEPDLYVANAGDLGDANLVSVLKPGESFSTSAD
jgi:hypothetical protein